LIVEVLEVVEVEDLESAKHESGGSKLVEGVEKVEGLKN
jgi:hypothetical protein